MKINAIVLPAVIFITLFGCDSERNSPKERKPGVAVLLVDTDREMGIIEEGIYGHFLEHINHSVVDGLYAEQIQGQGFEGEDYGRYWDPISEGGIVSTEKIEFNNVKFDVHVCVHYPITLEIML